MSYIGDLMSQLDDAQSRLNTATVDVARLTDLLRIENLRLANRKVLSHRNTQIYVDFLLGKTYEQLAKIHRVTPGTIKDIIRIQRLKIARRVDDSNEGNGSNF